MESNYNQPKLDDILNVKPKEEDNLYELAAKKVLEEDYISALTLINSFITKNPNNYKSYALRGRINNILEKFKEAIKDYTFIIDNSINLSMVADSYLYRGLAYYELSAEANKVMKVVYKELACDDWSMGYSIEKEIKYSGDISNFAFYSEFCYKNDNEEKSSSSNLSNSTTKKPSSKSSSSSSNRKSSSNNSVNNKSNTRMVSGIVSDEDGESLPAVNVILKGTNVGTTTDIYGKYSLKIPSSDLGQILVFSFVKLKTQEISVGRRKNVDVVMKKDKKKRKRKRKNE